MGLIIDNELANGVRLGYYRIVSLTTVVNQQTTVELAGYTSKDKRDEEMAEGADVYIDTQFIVLDYDPDMSVSRAYALIKDMEEFADAEDVVDAWQVGAAYFVGDVVEHGGDTYTCIQSHTSQAGWEPSEVPALWTRNAPAGEVPNWIQPTGAHDAYAAGDHVMHNGKEWASTIDANVYEPGVYGWDEV